jgi:hypothetical protein
MKIRGGRRQCIVYRQPTKKLVSHRIEGKSVAGCMRLPAWMNALKLEPVDPSARRRSFAPIGSLGPMLYGSAYINAAIP